MSPKSKPASQALNNGWLHYTLLSLWLQPFGLQTLLAGLNSDNSDVLSRLVKLDDLRKGCIVRAFIPAWASQATASGPYPASGSRQLFLLLCFRTRQAPTLQLAAWPPACCSDVEPVGIQFASHRSLPC